MPVSYEQRDLFVNRLAECARGGNEIAFAQLARTLGPLIEHEARRIYVPGADRDDVVQEALLALHAAVMTYDGEHPFTAFARLVIRRQLVSMLKTALRRKHEPLSTGARFEQSKTEGGPRLGDVIADRAPGPYERAVPREQLERVTAAAGRLTELERRAIGGLLSGIPYDQLGSKKSIDNAVQPARKQLPKACA